MVFPLLFRHGSPVMRATPTDATEITLESKVAFLRQSSSFPEPAYRVEAIETHMSWVFLTERFAYKLKKPVCHDFLDFRTIEARRHYCEEELRLNRRLAASVYLGLVGLSINPLGSLELGEHGTVLDWLVKMRRLPSEHMLDYAIRHRSASADDIGRVAARMAEFYRDCPPVALDPAAYRASFLHTIERNEETLVQPVYQLSIDHVHSLCRAQRDVLSGQSGWFDARVEAGRIIEGHGDLRPEHVCLSPTVAVIDCLEFSRALRILDAADELAYLALECERLGMPELGEPLLRAYGDVSGDRPKRALLHFYQSFRATLRARIAIMHLDEEKFRYSDEWRRRGIDYLQLAQRHQDAINSVSDSPA
jgi:aminoglycoside phosphotransferase family enzyme